MKYIAFTYAFIDINRLDTLQHEFKNLYVSQFTFKITPGISDVTMFHTNISKKIMEFLKCNQLNKKRANVLSQAVQMDLGHIIAITN